MANFIAQEEVLDSLKMFVFRNGISSDVFYDWLWFWAKLAVYTTRSTPRSEGVGFEPILLFKNNF